MAFKEVFLIALLIGVRVCEESQKCPPKEDIPRCSCDEGKDGTVVLHCNGFLTGKTIEDYGKLLKESNFAARKEFEIYFSRFNKESSLPSNVFEGLNIRRLYFLSSVVSRWADEEGGSAFVGLEDTLENLDFHNALNKVPKGSHQNDKAVMSLGHLRKLRNVLFRENSIDSFGADWFGNGSNSIELLSITHCGLSVIDDQAFAGLVNLKRIDVTMNKISEVTRSMFPNPANYLEEINLESNNLNVLPDDMFSNMPAIAHVDLGHNRIAHIPENVWRPVWSGLEFLRLRDNKLNCDDHMEWIFKVRRPKELVGECREPLEKRGTSLWRLIFERQRKDN